jgi:hypothetical protein
VTVAVGRHSHDLFTRPGVVVSEIRHDTRIARAVSEAWHSAKIKQFEHVLVGPSIALLRVTAKASRRKPIGEDRPTLLADDGHVVRRFVALPSPPDDRGVLRAAYSVPAEVIGADTVFSLSFDDGSAISLPEPTAGASRVTTDDDDDREGESDALDGAPTEGTAVPGPVTAAAAPLDGTPPRDAPGAEDPGAAQAPVAPRSLDPSRRPRERRSELTAKLTELSAALAESRHAAGELQAAREAARTEAVQARADANALAHRVAELEATAGQLEALTIEVQTLRAAGAQSEQALHDATERAVRAEAENEQSAGRLGELEIWRQELERRLTATTTELGEARTQLREDEDEFRAMREQLVEAEAHVELARSELTTLQAQVTADAEPIEGQGADPDAPAPDARARIRQLESERDELARRAQRLATLLGPVDQLTELARALTDARTEAEGLHAAAGSGVAGSGVAEHDSDDTAAAEPDLATNGSPTAEAATPATDEIEAISRRAEAEAEQQAARELAEAAEQARSPG